jgi:ribosome maturation factor RimP
MAQLTELKEIIEPLLTDMGIDLVDLQVQGRKGSAVLRIYVDEEGGISLARCASASRAISELLDQKDLFPGHYLLELSSPGIDRPLSTERDFVRHRGRKISLSYRKDGEEVNAKGVILRVEAGLLFLQSGEDTLMIPVDDVVLAKIIVELK